MTKTLTEQWREGTLERGYYYYKTKVGAKVIGYQCFGLKFPYDYNHNTIDSVEEALYHVPSYEEYTELLRHSELSRNLVYEVLVNQKEYNELLDKAKEYKRLQELLSQEEDRIKSLLERVGEADKIIKYYAEKHGKLKACDYLNKWGVK